MSPTVYAIKLPLRRTLVRSNSVEQCEMQMPHASVR